MQHLKKIVKKFLFCFILVVKIYPSEPINRQYKFCELKTENKRKIETKKGTSNPINKLDIKSTFRMIIFRLYNINFGGN